MARGLRKATLVVHLAVSVGWIGAVVAYLALDVTTATSEDAEVVRSAYIALDSIAQAVLVPLAVASLLSGVLLSLVTKWGLFRHYWVVISLLLTIIAAGVLFVETRVIVTSASVAADPTTSTAALRALPSTLVHSIGGLIVLLVILVLNVVKPRGLTRYGWRKEQALERSSV